MSAKPKAKKAAMPQKRTKTDASQAFDPKTIQEFKDAFAVMDQNKDGVIDKSDLKSLYAMMGQIQSDSVLEDMLKEAQGPLNFPGFLTLFGERLMGTDPEETIMGAFQMFDPVNRGTMKEEELVRVLKNPRGEPLSEEDIKAMYKGNPPIADGQVDYKAFVKMITTGGADELAKANA